MAKEIRCMSNDPFPRILFSISLKEKVSSSPETIEHDGHAQVKGQGAGAKYDSLYTETVTQNDQGFTHTYKSVLKEATQIHLVAVSQTDGGVPLSFKGAFEFAGMEEEPTQLSLQCKYLPD